MTISDVWDSLPDIDPLADEDITVESIVSEMVEDYEEEYEAITGEALTLYPADERKIRINAAAIMLYQLAVYGADRYKQNFLKYAYGDALKNLGANVGYTKTGAEPATTTLRFTLSDAQTADVTIPAGTQATAGDQIYFAVDEETVIPAGESYADTTATCTTEGTAGNGYASGQIHILVDPISYVESVSNVTESSGGHDEYTDEELRENIYYYPESYSVAGPEGAYITLAKEYSSNIIDVKVVANEEALVQIYVLMQNGAVPDTAKLTAIAAYLEDSGRTPDTDKVEVLAPTVTEYTIEATYYISYDKKESEDIIKEEVESMVTEFVDYTKSKIGRAINPGLLTSFVNAAGASRIAITTPDYTTIGSSAVAHCTSVNLTYGGLEKDV